MNKAKVYFTNLRTTPNSNLLDKMERLVRKAGIADISFEQQFTAIKIHFGEPGNLHTAQLCRPPGTSFTLFRCQTFPDRL